MTAWLQYRYGGPRERWWVKPPMPEESIDSLIERASHVYGGIVLKRGGWFTDVPPDLSSGPVSSPIPHEKEIGREEAFFRRADHWLSA